MPGRGGVWVGSGRSLLPFIFTFLMRLPRPSLPCSSALSTAAARNQLENLLQSFNRTLCKSVCEVSFWAVPAAPPQLHLKNKLQIKALKCGRNYVCSGRNPLAKPKVDIHLPQSRFGGCVRHLLPCCPRSSLHFIHNLSSQTNFTLFGACRSRQSHSQARHK